MLHTYAQSSVVVVVGIEYYYVDRRHGNDRGKCAGKYRIALYFRGPKLSHFEHAKQFQRNNFHDFWYGPHFLESFSPNALATSELAVDMDDVGISFDKRPAKAHLELLVAACNNFEKGFVVHKFRGFPKFVNNAKNELLEN